MNITIQLDVDLATAQELLALTATILNSLESQRRIIAAAKSLDTQQTELVAAMNAANPSSSPLKGKS
jgi:hypothetical protein